MLHNIAPLRREKESEQFGVYHFGRCVDDLDAAEMKAVRPAAPFDLAEVLRGKVQGSDGDGIGHHHAWAGAVKDAVRVQN